MIQINQIIFSFIILIKFNKILNPKVQHSIHVWVEHVTHKKQKPKVISSFVTVLLKG